MEDFSLYCVVVSVGLEMGRRGGGCRPYHIWGDPLSMIDLQNSVRLVVNSTTAEQ